MGAITSPAPNTDPQIDEAVAALQKRMADALAPFLGKPHCAEASRQELIKAVERFFSVDENLGHFGHHRPPIPPGEYRPRAEDRAGSPHDPAHAGCVMNHRTDTVS